MAEKIGRRLLRAGRDYKETGITGKRALAFDLPHP
jgi:hypothetical protein